MTARRPPAPDATPETDEVTGRARRCCPPIVLRPGSPPEARDAAEIVAAFYRYASPKPAQPVRSMVLTVSKLLRAGWSRSQLMAALPEASNVSVGALTFMLNQHKRATSGGGREVVSVSDGDAVVRLVEAANRVLVQTEEAITLDALEALADALDGTDPLYDRLLVARAERETRQAP